MASGGGGGTASNVAGRRVVVVGRGGAGGRAAVGGGVKKEAATAGEGIGSELTTKFVKLKQGLKIAMSISGEGNAYLQVKSMIMKLSRFWYLKLINEELTKFCDEW
ncbi:hypothetical protein L1987_63608 [Smallanthus sonchifolius]|uniref:Uncharacterized protein n=1 Tax=Smallanthus sonchifolius TaxID=185202 RepID=A0ACB9CDS9_9ASTR|nr:hypothetical protein L1987_63608 [Smallanthus sonchifolius]